MNPEENVEATPSEENGNIPLDIPETPSETPEPETPAEVVETPAAEPELFELPDGRKVDAPTLSKEWKENFYPEYTRKSQELAKKETPIEKLANPLEDPNYTPPSYAELARQIKEDTLREIEGKETAKIEAQRAIETAVEGQLQEIKKVDPTLNESTLFVHANKYGFRDLKQAHQNMKDMSELAKNVKQTTAKEIAKRADPVSVSPGATGTKPDPSQFATARDYLRSLK